LNQTSSSKASTLPSSYQYKHSKITNKTQSATSTTASNNIPSTSHFSRFKTRKPPTTTISHSRPNTSYKVTRLENVVDFNPKMYKVNNLNKSKTILNKNVFKVVNKRQSLVNNSFDFRGEK